MEVGSMAISGLIASDIDISGVITQLAQIRRKPVAILEQEQSHCSKRLAAFQQLTARCLSLSTAASALTDGRAFEEVSVRSSDDASVAVSASAGAPLGAYRVEVTQLAQCHRVSSASIAGTTEALGGSGEILINGHAVVVESDFSLQDLRDAINAAGAGVSASILTGSESEHYLRLTSLTSGADGAIEIADVSDILESLGVQDSSVSTKHAIASGMASDAIADRISPAADALGLTSTLSGTISLNGTNVAVDLSTDSLNDIAAAIDAVAGVSASAQEVEVDGQTRYRLEIVGDSGTPALIDDGNVLLALGVQQKGFANEVDAAQDALFSIDGVSMSRSTNAIDDAIENVQLQLQRETVGTPVTVTVDADTAATVDAVGAFVKAYNQVVDFLNQHQTFNTDTEEGGLFFGSPAILQVETQLREQISQMVNTLGGDLTYAGQVGLTFNAADEIVFDSRKLLDALETNPEGVKRLFGSRAEASGDVEVFSHASATADSGPEGWEISISQAATRPTATSAGLAAGITADETLTVNGKSINLTAGMSLQDAADHLNAVFTSERMDITASLDGDSLVLQHDLWGDSHSLEIVSSLDHGAGGTDLGGPTAGEAATYEGQDVIGTIDGEETTGNGRLLIGRSGTEMEGLQLVVTATNPGNVGTVHVSKGIASRMNAFIERITESETGALTRAAEGQSDEISAIDERIAELEADVDRYIQQLQADFAQMESKMAQSMNLLDWMENQVQYLPGAGRDD